MATGFQFKGLDQLQRDFQAISQKASTTAVQAAEDAAANVFEPAIRAAAATHHLTGQLESSVQIIQSKTRNLYATEKGRRGLFVGPEKRKGYYGYFLDQGWRATGRAVSVNISWYGVDRGVQKTRRIGRESGKQLGHSQQGGQAGRQIPGDNWFTSVVSATMSLAYRAFESEFFARLTEGQK